jgi:hypothetical protein
LKNVKILKIFIFEKCSNFKNVKNFKKMVSRKHKKLDRNVKNWSGHLKPGKKWDI